MTITEALKEFYKDNVTDVNKLNDADSVLEVLRAKYGDYKGANIEEYFKELNANDITPGGSTPTGTIYITENGEGIDVSSYATADVNVSGGSSTIPVITAFGEDIPSSFSCDTSYSDFADLISNSSYGNDKIYPCVLVFETDNSALIGTASMYNSNIEIQVFDGQISYHPDGTITIGN